MTDTQPITDLIPGRPRRDALCGLVVTTQARLTGSGAPMALTNAQDLRLGFH